MWFKKKKEEKHKFEKHKFEEQVQDGCEKCGSKMRLWGVRKLGDSEEAVYLCVFCGNKEVFTAGKRSKEQKYLIKLKPENITGS